MNDLIERSMVFDVIDKSETVDETYWRVRSLPPVPAISISVIEQIKAEIEEHCCFTVGSENDPAITLHDVFEIIDKVIGGKDEI